MKINKSQSPCVLPRLESRSLFWTLGCSRRYHSLKAAVCGGAVTSLSIGLIALSILFPSCKSYESKNLPKNFERKIDKLNVKNNTEDKYAILICGKNEERFSYDLSAIYHVLLRRGFKEKDIIILDEYGNEEFLYHSDGIASAENIEKAFSNLEKIVDDKDILVVHLDNHGKRIDMQSKFGIHPFTSVSLCDSSLTRTELKSYLEKIKPKLGIVTVDTCFAEGMIDWCKSPYIGISSSEENKLGYSSVRDSFGGHFYLTFCNYNPNNNLTIEDAVDIAKINHTPTKNGITKPKIITSDGLEKMIVPD